MIFITLGSQKFQFNRLLKEIDRLIAEKTITEQVYAQIGYSDYMPKNFAYKKFMDRDEFSDMQDKSQIIITHAGTGAIMGALKKGKKVIAVPRLAQYGEHVDDHQIQIIDQFKKMNLIYGIYDVTEIADALKAVDTAKFNEYVSHTENFVSSIENYLLGE